MKISILFSVHDYGVVHGSEANNSDDRRIGFAIAFIDTLGKVNPIPVIIQKALSLDNEGWHNYIHDGVIIAVQPKNERVSPEHSHIPVSRKSVFDPR